jgi:hypothetical protein
MSDSVSINKLTDIEKYQSVWRPTHYDGSYKDTDPGSIRLVRTASKAFGEGSGGDDKSGCQGNFKLFVKEFLTQHRMKRVPLRSFRGTRFNILFQNASTIFFLHSKMAEFLESYGAENRLLKSILQLFSMIYHPILI